MVDQRWKALLEALAMAFDQEGRVGGDAAAAALRAATHQSYRPVSGNSDPGDLLMSTCTAETALDVAADVLACRDQIAWTNWGADELEGDVSSRLYTAELVGPDGHFHANDVRVGLLVSDAHTDYHVSRHSGEETYLVISGTAEWTVDGLPYVKQPPGSLVHHPSWVRHGRRTLDEPFLGAWRWSGDLDLSSFKVEP